MTRYAPTGESAAGGMGSVVFYQDRNLDRRVAVKFMNRGGEHRRILDELSALQTVSSKHVVEIYDVGYFAPGQQMGIIEEYIDGTNLSLYLGKVPADSNLVRLTYQLASGLADIHAVNIVHRDIKPTNVIVDSENIVKIVDFNLSRTESDAHTSGFVGTVGYAAPELYGTGQRTFSTKVDLYAMGITIWALVNGPTLPPELLERPPRPAAWRAAGGKFKLPYSTFDRQLGELIVACLSEDPALRPSAAMVRDRAARILLRGMHRALFVDDLSGAHQELDSRQRTVLLRGTGASSITILYDGLDFMVTKTTGTPQVNNCAVQIGTTLPHCCVIDLDRKFFTMDVSHPEVVL